MLHGSRYNVSKALWDHLQQCLPMLYFDWGVSSIITFSSLWQLYALPFWVYRKINVSIKIAQKICRFGTVLLAFNSLRWRHNGRDSVSKHKLHECLLNRLFRHRTKKTSKLPVTGLCVGNSPWGGEFPAQMASNAKNVSIWWRHHVAKFVLSLVFLQCAFPY